MKKQFITLSLAAIIGTSGAFIPLSNKALAETFEQKKAKIQHDRSNIQSNIEAKKNELKDLEAKKNQLNAEVEKLNEQLLDTGEKIEAKEKEINKTKADIEELKKQIEEVKQRIEKRNDLLKERAKSLQESGGVINYLDVLLGAKSFNDFVNRISAVTTLVEADRKIIEEHQRDMKVKEEAEAKLNQDLSNLEKALSELAALKQDLDKKVDEKDRLLGVLEVEYGQAMDELDELADHEAFLKEQERIIEQQQQEYIRKQKAQATSTSHSNSSSAPSVSSAAGSGAFIWPASGVLTSKMGSRWGRFHAGIDIAKRGTVPVYASAGGTVSFAGQMRGYGNVILITHNINGKIYTTLYGHLRSINVSNGQRVSQGQFIGYMGNTGRSTGQHLHFEVHNGPWQGKSNVINPLSVLP